MTDRDYEAEALEQGYNPDFDGPNKVDAKTFVEKGERIAGIANKRLEKAESQIKTLQESNRQFGEYHKQTLETQKRKNAETIAGLEGQLEQAITDGDGAAYTRVNREINDLKVEAPVPDDAAEWGRLVSDWQGNDGSWYLENPKLRRYADGLSDELRSEGFGGTLYFEELTRRVQEDFPDDFKNPNQTKPNGVETGGQLSVTDSKDKTYDNLPPDAKAAQVVFERDFGLSREDYVKQYEWEE